MFALLASSPLASARQALPAKFDVVKVAEGVYAAVRRDPPGFAVESNSVFIVGDDGVIVVGPAVESAFNDATSKR